MTNSYAVEKQVGLVGSENKYEEKARLEKEENEGEREGCAWAEASQTDTRSSKVGHTERKAKC